MAAGGKYTPSFKRKRDEDEIYRQDVSYSAKDSGTLRAEPISQDEAYNPEPDFQPRQSSRNVPSYPTNSVAYQQNRNGNMYAYGYSGHGYDGRRETGFGIGGAPADGDTHGRGLGQTIGAGAGKVFGTIFAPVNWVMNGAVNVLRGVKDSTGMDIGVGVSQGNGYGHNGYGYGNHGNSFSVGGSFNSYNSGRYRQNMSGGEETGGLISGMFGNRRNNIEPRADGLRNTDFFKSDTSLFAMVGEGHIPSMTGAPNSIFNKPSEANKAFIEGYKNTLGEFRSLTEDSRRAQENSDFQLPPTAVVRQDLCAAVMDATMKHAATHPQDYYHTNTSMAAKSYERIVGDRWSAPLPEIQEKSTINNLQKAFGAASASDAQTLEVADIVAKFRQSGNEAALNVALGNFMSGRSALVRELNSEQQQLHASLSEMQFADPTAQTVQNKLLSDAKIWKDAHGVVTDADAQAFGVFQRDGQFVLRMKLDGQKVDMPIPAENMESTLAMIGKFSISDKTADVVFKDSLDKVLAEVKTYPQTEESAAFVANLESAKQNIAAAEQKSATEALAKTEAEKAEATKVAKAAEELTKKADEVNQVIAEAKTKVDGFNEKLTKSQEALAKIDEALKIDPNSEKLKIGRAHV